MPPDTDAPPWLDAAALRAALPAAGESPPAGCAHCQSLACPGWESLPAPLGPPLLQALGTLCDPSDTEPTLTERHAPGTHFWHPRALVATRYFPYNRCSVWCCPPCGRGFVQYTEAGGYYVDHRIRAIDPALIVD